MHVTLSAFPYSEQRVTPSVLPAAPATSAAPPGPPVASPGAAVPDLHQPYAGRPADLPYTARAPRELPNFSSKSLIESKVFIQILGLIRIMIM